MRCARLLAAPHPGSFKPVKLGFSRQFATGVFSSVEPREGIPPVIWQRVDPVDQVEKRDIPLAILGVSIFVVRSPELIGKSARVLLSDRIARRKVHLVGHDEMIRGSLVSCDEEIRAVCRDTRLFVQVLGSASGYR